MNVIEINSEKYKDYLHLDIIAFSFAGEGRKEKWVDLGW